MAVEQASQMRPHRKPLFIFEPGSPSGKNIANDKKCQ
jgi:hypothetical protein